MSKAPNFHDGLERFNATVKGLGLRERELAESVLIGALSVSASKDAWDSAIRSGKDWIDRTQAPSQEVSQ